MVEPMSDAAAALAPGERIVLRAQSLAREADAAIAEIAEALGPGPFALVCLFCSSDRSPEDLGAAVARRLSGVPVVGCSTAGEIGLDGYLDGAIAAFALPLSHFRVDVMILPDLARFSEKLSVGEILRRRSQLAAAAPNWASEFAFLLSDGLSLREDQLVSALGPALGSTPLFGGSAGDAVRFGRTSVLAGGEFRSNMSALCLIRTVCRVKVFRFDHLEPTDIRMVVTDADPESRLVREINAEPAARAYARALGKDPDQLSPFIFAAHPMVVRTGGKHHVCAIQRVEENGDLRFFTSIDVGLVLTLAQGQDIARHLDRSMEELSPDETPDAIIGCECVLRRLEIEQTQNRAVMSRTLKRHNVIGFNGYGEQFNMLHVNQTFTGVAIYSPRRAGGGGD
jgi:hypothetical protein